MPFLTKITNFWRAGLIAIVAIIAFISGAGAAVVVMVRAREAVGPTVAPEKAFPSSKPLPILEGRLIDKTTGDPLPYVEIGLLPGPDMRRYTFTDSDGRFVFVNPPNTPYRLEAGKERWNISLSGRVSTSVVLPPRDSFEFLTPSNVTVRDKAGQRLEGERVEFHGTANGKPFPPAGKEYRRFFYSTSIVELQAENLQAGKVNKR